LKHIDEVAGPWLTASFIISLIGEMRFAQIEVALDSASCFVRELALTVKVIRP
jgi:hypothetical protein